MIRPVKISSDPKGLQGCKAEFRNFVSFDRHAIRRTTLTTAVDNPDKTDVYLVFSITSILREYQRNCTYTHDWVTNCEEFWYASFDDMIVMDWPCHHNIWPKEVEAIKKAVAEL